MYVCGRWSGLSEGLLLGEEAFYYHFIHRIFFLRSEFIRSQG